MSYVESIEALCDQHNVDCYFTYNEFIGVQVSPTLTHWYLKTDAGYELSGTTPEPHGEPIHLNQEESMKRRRNAPISAQEASVLRRLLARHGYRSNPGARPGENQISTEIIRKRKNPRRKTKMFGPGKRWKNKKAMCRYLSKIRVKAMRAIKRRRR